MYTTLYIRIYFRTFFHSSRARGPTRTFLSQRDASRVCCVEFFVETRGEKRPSGIGMGSTCTREVSLIGYYGVEPWRERKGDEGLGGFTRDFLVTMPPSLLAHPSK